MSPVTSAPVFQAPVTEEELGQLEIALPTVSVISYAGPGGTGGVPASLSPVVKRLNTRVNWFSITDVPDTDFSPNAAATSGFTFHSPQIPDRLIAAHRRFCQEYLNPLLHGFPEKAVFDQEDWKSFKQLCELIASQCLIANSDSYPSLFWLHDFQMALCSMIIAPQAGIILSQFWHTPFPSASVMTAYPCGKELTEALMQNRLVGFQIKTYADNFLDTVEHFYPDAQIDREELTIVYRGKKTSIAVMPLGVDVPYWQKLATEARAQAEALAPKHGLSSQIILGVDRLEPSKGVLEKLCGLEHFMQAHPEVRKRFHYVQLAQTLRAEGEKDEYKEQVERKISAVNNKFGHDGWQPIIYINANHSQADLAAWYQAASVLCVNSVADGLNLIAKEYVASRHDEQGVLVLSQNAGVASELSFGAVLVNPQDAEQVGEGLFQALSFDSEEKRRRMVTMRHVLGWNQLHHWAVGFLRKAITV